MSDENREHGDVICMVPEPPRKPVPMTAVRSTLVTSGLGTLRSRNLFEPYLAALPAAHREMAVSAVAGLWFPVEFMQAHYEAYDALQLSPEEVRAMGRSIAERLNESILQALRRLATSAGITPWVAFSQYGRFWTRAFEGGGVRITKVGPKDAKVEFSQVPFARSAYFRGTFCAIHEVGLGLFSPRVYVRLLSTTLSDSGFALRISWV
jgi:hypothetical protein